MAGKRWDALTVREKDGKSYWTKIGVMFESRDGGFMAQLDALPIDGKIVFREPRSREGSDERRGSTQGAGFGSDDVPFAREDRG